MNKKNALQTLVRMSLEDKDYSRFRATFEVMNPKLTDEDFKPMFPEGWSDDKNWFASETETNAQFWEKWQHYQMRIDDELERQAGCYD